MVEPVLSKDKDISNSIRASENNFREFFLLLFSRNFTDANFHENKNKVAKSSCPYTDVGIAYFNIANMFISNSRKLNCGKNSQFTVNIEAIINNLLLAA